MEEAVSKKIGKQHNTLPLWGNEASMNLNPLILANIQGSSYFKVHLFKLKTYHEVVDEIYYQVKHMEPWERGSRKTSGQTGMCGGVRGVGAGGIVSTAYCLLYKLYTLRLTRKQINGLLNHTDSPYIRALGFMYLRYTQPPGDLYDWYEDYLQDEEEIDVKAGGGHIMTIGQMVYHFLTKLDWFSTLFPRIPVPIQKQIEKKLEQYCRTNQISLHQLSSVRPNAAAAANSAIGVGGGGGGGGVGVGSGDFESEDTTYDRRGGGVGSGAGAGSSRDMHSNRELPPVSNYRNDHDDRDYHTSSSSAAYHQQQQQQQLQHHHRRHRDKSTPVNDGSSSSRDRHHEKHKKKHKHKHRTRSRSRSRSRSHSHSSRSRSDRKRDWEYERNSSHAKSRDYDEQQQQTQRRYQ